MNLFSHRPRQRQWPQASRGVSFLWLLFCVVLCGEGRVSRAQTTQNTIQNGGFETPSVGAQNYSTSVPGSGWNFQYAGIASNGSRYSNGTAPEGVQVAFVERQGYVSQTVPMSAGDYKVRLSTAGNGSSIPSSFEVKVDGTVVSQFTAAYGYSNYQEVVTASFTVTAGDHVISLSGQSNNGTVFIDNVRLEAQAVPDTTLPEVPSLLPADQVTVTQISGISGTVRDPIPANGTPASGVATLSVVLSRRARQGYEYWAGGAWYLYGTSNVNPSVPITLGAPDASGQIAWTYTPALPSGANLAPGRYYVRADVADRAGNPNSRIHSFLVGPVDATAAQATLTTPAPNSVVHELTSLSGTAFDPPEANGTPGSGVYWIEIALQRSGSATPYWNGTAWDTGGTMFATLSAPDASGRLTWTYNGPLPSGAQLTSGLYTARVFVYDRFNDIEYPYDFSVVSPLGSWQAGAPIRCGGIRWPRSGQTIAVGSEGHLSSFLATDYDQLDVNQPDQTVSSRILSDPCSYVWSATWGDGSPAGSFKGGNNRGQGVVWIAPTTSGTVTLRLVVDDQNATNQGRKEVGQRNDAPRGYNDEPLTFSTSISVGP